MPIRVILSLIWKPITFDFIFTTARLVSMCTAGVREFLLFNYEKKNEKDYGCI